MYKIMISRQRLNRQSLINALVSKAEVWRHCEWGHSYSMVESKYFIYILSCTPYGGYRVWDWWHLVDKDYAVRDWNELTWDYDRGEPDHCVRCNETMQKDILTGELVPIKIYDMLCLQCIYNDERDISCKVCGSSSEIVDFQERLCVDCVSGCDWEMA